MDVWLPLGLSGVASLLLYFPALLVTRDAVRAALLAAVATVVFFSFGFIRDALGDYVLRMGAVTVDARMLAYAGSALAVVGSFVALRRTGSSPLTLFRIARTMGAVFLVSALVFAGYSSLAASSSGRALGEGPDVPMKADATPPDPASLPDIYYIVLDAYGREDVLEAASGFSNREFIECLESRGFYVADLSNSNYAVTQLSLASSLSMDYLDAYATTADGDQAVPRIRPLVDAPPVAETLQDHGYTFVHVDSGWSFTSRPTTADIRIRPSRERSVLLEFLRTTLVEQWVDRYTTIDKRKHILETFSLLASVDEHGRGPFFVFSHILVPHRPYVFGPGGEAVSPDRWGSMAGREGPLGFEPYLDQLVYTNELVRELVDELLSDRTRPLIVAIQSDHGIRNRRPDEPGLDDARVIRERHAILNAYYFSEELPEALYPSITPVNTFRVIFDEVLGADLGLLDDRSYYSSHLLDLDVPWGEIEEVTSVVSTSGPFR